MWPFKDQLSACLPKGMIHYVDRKGQTLLRFPYFRGCIIPGIGAEIHLTEFSGSVDWVVITDRKPNQTEDWDVVKIVVAVYSKDTPINTDA